MSLTHQEGLHLCCVRVIARHQLRFWGIPVATVCMSGNQHTTIQHELDVSFAAEINCIAEHMYRTEAY